MRSVPLASGLDLNAALRSIAPALVANGIQAGAVGASVDSTTLGGSTASASGIVTPFAAFTPWLADSYGPESNHAPTCPSNDGAMCTLGVVTTTALASPV